jgi:hypothetical protein
VEGDEQLRNSWGSIVQIVEGDAKADADKARQLPRMLLDALSVEEIDSLIANLIAALSEKNSNRTLHSPASE